MFVKPVGERLLGMEAGHDENHRDSQGSITEIPRPLSDEVDDKVHSNEVGPFKAGGAYANQPEEPHSPCWHREKTGKHTHSTTGSQCRTWSHRFALVQSLRPLEGHRVYVYRASLVTGL